jgi:Ca-activated chloride channel homolog
MNWEWLTRQAFALIAVPAVLWLWTMWKGRKPRRRLLYKFSTPSSALAKQSNKLKSFFRATWILGGLGLIGLAIALARPVSWESTTKKTAEGIDIVITLDVSESMIADDFKPNRMVVAKKVIQDFIKKRPDDRIGLVTFGGEAVTRCPLTEDHDFLLSQVEEVQMRELKQGTAIGMGLSNAILRLQESKAKTKIVVLLTDGDSNVGDINPITASHLAREDGIKIYSIGIGKDNRVLVPIYSYDAYGNRRGLIAQVPSYINPELLREISQITGGRHYMARNTGMLVQILAEIDKLEKSKILMKPRLKKIEEYLWPAALGLLALFIVWALMETKLRRARIHVVQA